MVLIRQQTGSVQEAVGTVLGWVYTRGHHQLLQEADGGHCVLEGGGGGPGPHTGPPLDIIDMSFPSRAKSKGDHLVSHWLKGQQCGEKGRDLVFACRSAHRPRAVRSRPAGRHV